MVNQLIVLGNGFDCACRLLSKYDNFLKNRYKVFGVNSYRELEKAVKECFNSVYYQYKNGESCSLDSINAWDLIFAKYALDNNVESWSSVEDVIAEWVTHPRSESVYDFDLIARQDLSGERGDLEVGSFYTVDDIEPCHRANVSSMMGDAELMSDDEVLLKDRIGFYDTLEQIRTLRCLDRGASNDVYYSPSHQGRTFLLSDNSILRESYASLFRDFLFSELRLFENEFANYLKSYPIGIDGRGIEHSASLYQKRASCLLSEILKSDIDDDNVCNNYVLSFNYTRVLCSRLVSYRNVHGVLSDEGGNDLIFGIDAIGNMSDSHISQFTKTARIFMNANADSSLGPSLFSLMDKGENYDIIKVFGHGLGIADYSYFEALFDTVDLLSGRVKIIFYYTDNKRPNIQSIIDLLNKYANNRYSGNVCLNLPHRLIFEDRLKIRELPSVAHLQ